MPTVKTLSQFQEILDSSFGWRIVEISDLKTSISSASGKRQTVLIRAGIPLLYAHWEGFVKNASDAYLEFVCSRELTFRELKACFIAQGMQKYISQLSRES